MRRIDVYVDDDLYDALSAEAARRGTSRSALVRDAVRAMLDEPCADAFDPIEELIGAVDIEPVDDIDAVIYGWKA